ncbi:hypothetical protein BC828DRAFT_382416, partial [Blastocladiella britannica]
MNWSDTLIEALTKLHSAYGDRVDLIAAHFMPNLPAAEVARKLVELELVSQETVNELYPGTLVTGTHRKHWLYFENGPPHHFAPVADGSFQLDHLLELASTIADASDSSSDGGDLLRERLRAVGFAFPAYFHVIEVLIACTVEGDTQTLAARISSLSAEDQATLVGIVNSLVDMSLSPSTRPLRETLQLLVQRHHLANLPSDLAAGFIATESDSRVFTELDATRRALVDASDPLGMHSSTFQRDAPPILAAAVRTRHGQNINAGNGSAAASSAHSSRQGTPESGPPIATAAPGRGGRPRRGRGAAQRNVIAAPPRPPAPPLTAADEALAGSNFL